MISTDEMKIYLKNNLLENRFIHTLGVVDTAIRLAKINGVDEKKAERYSEVIDEYYNYVNEFPEGKNIKDADKILKEAKNYLKEK